MVLPKDFFISEMLVLPNKNNAWNGFMLCVWLVEIPCVETVYSFAVYVYEHCTNILNGEVIMVVYRTLIFCVTWRQKFFNQVKLCFIISFWKKKPTCHFHSNLWLYWHKGQKMKNTYILLPLLYARQSGLRDNCRAIKLFSLICVSLFWFSDFLKIILVLLFFFLFNPHMKWV